MTKRGFTSGELLAMIAMLAVLLLSVYLVTQYVSKPGQNIVKQVFEWAGLKQPDKVPAAPSGQMNPNYVSIGRVIAGDRSVPAIAINTGELLKQTQTNLMVVEKWPILASLPITISFDVPISRSKTAGVPPNLLVKYCDKLTSKWNPWATVDCTFRNIPDLCADPAKCSMDYAKGELTINALYGPGWYQIQVQPDAQPLYTDKKELPINPNNAIIQFQLKTS